MKKVLFLGFLGLLLIGCQGEEATELPENNSGTANLNANLIALCHWDSELQVFKVINVNENAVNAHLNHGDVQLIDEDGDGYVTSENECGLPVDCDDTDAELTDNCSTSCVEGEVEIDFNGPLFVAPADEPGLYTLQGAIDKCNEKDTNGCDWYLPSKEELNALFLARNNIGGFNQSGSFPGSYYRSSTPNQPPPNNVSTWSQRFNNGLQVFVGNNIPIPCRCVRR